MKATFGILMILCGLALGLYVGVWLCLIGGIVQFIEAVKATPADAWGVAFGITRFLCASAAGGLAGVVFIVPGWLTLNARK